MPRDWRDEIDKRLAELERREVEKHLREKQEDFEYSFERLMERHRRRFRCHICRKPSEGPRLRYDSIGPVSTVWDAPTGLSKCSRCEKWTCPDHLHRGYCKRCAYRI
jgi:hypothetical protein